MLTFAAAGESPTIAHYAMFLPLTALVWAYGVYNGLASDGLVRVTETDYSHGTREVAVGPVWSLFKAFYQRMAESCARALKP